MAQPDAKKDERKIEWKYDTDGFDCYEITTNLSAWIAKDKSSLLFGSGCKPDDQGLKDAALKGILLNEEDIKSLLAKNTDLTIDQAFTSTDIRPVFIQFSPIITLRVSLYKNTTLGKCVTFIQGSRFACISQRRFKQLLEVLGSNYIESTAPVFSLPDVFKNVH